MDFFAHQEEAQRITRRLVVLFALAVVAIVVAVYLAVALLLFGAGASNHGVPGAAVVGIWQPELFVVVAIGTLLVIAGGSGFKTLQLRDGGSAVARLLGGRRVDPNTSDPAERRLRNVVEEMALASGLPVPEVYVLDRETGINAFAAGHDPSDAVIAVTDGTLHLLSRDELQGVVAHEFSHILHGDMRLDLRLMGLVFGILAISSIGYILMRTGFWGGGRRRGKGGGGLAMVGLALYAIGWIGVFFGRLIKAAVSRQREFLADASAVQYTRNPSGIAGALKKIGGYSTGSRVRDGHAEEASHLFFADGLRARWFGMTATHPPLAERIRRIDPSFDGTFPEVRWPEDDAQGPATRPAPPREAASTPLPAAPVTAALAGAPGGGAATSGSVAGGGGGAVPSPADFAAAAGTVDPSHLAWAAALLDGLPEALGAAAREPDSASSLVYALLLDRNDEVRAVQRRTLERAIAPAAVAATARLWAEAERAGRSARLPLADLALPALRRLSPDQYRRFRRTVTALAEADHRIDLFEYALKRMILRNLEPHFAPRHGAPEGAEGAAAAPGAGVQLSSLRRVSAEVSCLLSTLAWSGTGDPEGAAAAVGAGAAELEGLVEVETLDAESCRLSALDGALDRLARAAPRLRERLLRAAVAVVGADRRVVDAEAELLRAIADGLDCPVPPFLTSRSAPATASRGPSA